VIGYPDSIEPLYVNYVSSNDCRVPRCMLYMACNSAVVHQHHHHFIERAFLQYPVLHLHSSEYQLNLTIDLNGYFRLFISIPLMRGSANAFSSFPPDGLIWHNYLLIPRTMGLHLRSLGAMAAGEAFRSTVLSQSLDSQWSIQNRSVHRHPPNYVLSFAIVNYMFINMSFLCFCSRPITSGKQGISPGS
jgi:hypothetical protein